MSDFMPGVKVLLQVAQQQVDIGEERIMNNEQSLCLSREFMWNIRVEIAEIFTTNF